MLTASARGVDATLAKFPRRTGVSVDRQDHLRGVAGGDKGAGRGGAVGEEGGGTGHKAGAVDKGG